MEQLPILIRAATLKDLPFFFSSTLRNYLYSSDWGKNLVPNLFFIEHRAALERLLHNSKLYIACDPQDQDVIMGFCLAKAPIIDYVYVKESFRGFGVARMLLEKAGIDLKNCACSHWTKAAMHYWRQKKYQGMVYNPYLLMR